MIFLDTCAVIFDALQPEKLSKTAEKIIKRGYTNRELCLPDICLWEISMLIEKKRLDPGIETLDFLNTVLLARKLTTIPINTEIASISCQPKIFNHFDPCDRLIAATAIYYQSPLITCDKKLHQIKNLEIYW